MSLLVGMLFLTFSKPFFFGLRGVYYTVNSILPLLATSSGEGKYYKKKGVLCTPTSTVAFV